MKKFFLAAVLFCSLAAFANPVVNPKVLEAFHKTFQNATEVSWTELKDSYEVKFIASEIRMRVIYDPSGNILSTIRYYNEDKLPVLILTKVKSRFAGKKIFGATEESNENGMQYHIILEDDKGWTTILAEPSGAMSVERKMRKS